MNWSWLLPEIKGIPVLMYHRVWPGQNDFLTIDPDKLKEQWLFLQNEGYIALSLREYIDIAKGVKKDFPAKSMLITFDDGYLNNLTYVYPLLLEMGWNATFFIIADTLDGTANAETDPVNAKMTVNELQHLDPSVVQLALHGYHHENFKQTALNDIQTIMSKSIEVMDNSGLPYFKVLAYPYGARPKNNQILSALKLWMKENGIEAAFRIGNQVSKTPAPDLYEIRRIDFRGTDTLKEFTIKLKKGKLKPF